MDWSKVKLIVSRCDCKQATSRKELSNNLLNISVGFLWHAAIS